MARHLETTFSRRRAVWTGIATVVLVAIGILEARTFTLETQLAARRRDLASVEEWAVRYQNLRAALDVADRSAAPRPGTTSTSMWRAVETAARSTVGTQRVASLTPVDRAAPNIRTGVPGATSPVRQELELRVEGAPLPRIVDLLHALRHGTTALDVERLRLTRSTGADGALDATLAIVGSIPAR